MRAMHVTECHLPGTMVMMQSPSYHLLVYFRGTPLAASIARPLDWGLGQMLHVDPAKKGMAACAGRWKGAMVAVKVIEHSADINSKIEGFRETMVSSNIQHPNVVSPCPLTPCIALHCIISRWGHHCQ